MKLTFSIAKNEFRYLFYSLVAWFVLIIFLIQCAYFYTASLVNVTFIQQLMAANSPAYTDSGVSMTSALFLKSGFFSGILGNLYIFIPILTMGLISRESNNNTSALLFSSPVSVKRIVLGKYIGIMQYNLLLVAIISVFLIAGMINIKHVDYGVLLSALLGFYLLICTYSALGLFMSTLSNYQIVSAIATLTAVFMLTRIGTLWQRYDLVRDLTYFLSLQNRTGFMIGGMIVSRDVIYFILITIMFVVFTIIKLRNNREAIPWYMKAGRYAGVLAIVLMIGYISSRPMLTGYLDTTADQRNTLHTKTQNALQEFKDSTIEVTLYTNLLGEGLARGLPEMRNADYLTNCWEPYLRFKPDIQFKYVYYYDYDPAKDDSSFYKSYPGQNLSQIAGVYAELLDAPMTMFRSPDEMRKTDSLGKESNRLVMKLKYKGRSAFLRTYGDPGFWPDEMNMNAVFRRLLDSSMPHIAYVCGQLERSISKTGEREYALHSANAEGRGSLVNTGFDVDSINLNKQDIPSDLTALVIADPKMEFSTVVLDKLKSYVNKGGNLLVSGEPGKQYVLNPLLSALGVQLMDGQLVQPRFDETPDKITSYVDRSSASLSEGIQWLNKLNQDDSFMIITPGATSIARSNDTFKNVTLTETQPGRTWLRAGELITDSILPPFNEAKGDVLLSTFPTIVQLKRALNGKEQRVIIAGDADFASNIRLMTNGTNFMFLMPCYSWLVNNRFPVYAPRPGPKDTSIDTSLKATEIQKIFFVWVLPGLLLIAAIVLLIRRKRK